MQLTGLEFGVLKPWQLILKDHYPSEDRSTLDALAWSEFVHSYENRPSELNLLLGEFAKTLNSAQVWREDNDKVRGAVEQNAPQRQTRIANHPTLKTGNWKSRVKQLQLLLNALIFEEKTQNELASFTHELEQFLGPDRAKWDLKKSYEEAKKRNTANLNRVLNDDNHFYEGELLSAFQKTTGKMESIFINFETQQISSMNNRAKRCAKAIREIEKLKTQYTLEDPLKSLSQHPRFWQKAVCEIETSFKFQIWKLKANDQLARVVESSVALYEKEGLDNSFAALGAPALDVIHKRFVPLWEKSMSSDNPYDIQTPQLIGDIHKTKRLLQIANATRPATYVELFAQLQKNQPAKGIDRRQFHQFTKLVIEIPETEGALPSSLLPQANTEQKKMSQSPQKVIVPLKPFKESQVPIALQDAQPSSSQSDDQLTLVLKTKTSLKLGAWKSSFQYHRRVQRWFETSLPLSKTRFPEYHLKSPQYQQLMLRLHRLIPLVDFFSLRGLMIKTKSKRGGDIERRILPAEIETSLGKQQGVIIWAINTQKICYHRFFHIKLESEQILNTVKKAFTDSQSVEEDELSSKDSTLLEFFNSADDFVEVDEISETATLRNSQIKDLILRLQFLKL